MSAVKEIYICCDTDLVKNHSFTSVPIKICISCCFCIMLCKRIFTRWGVHHLHSFAYVFKVDLLVVSLSLPLCWSLVPSSSSFHASCSGMFLLDILCTWLSVYNVLLKLPRWSVYSDPYSSVNSVIAFIAVITYIVKDRSLSTLFSSYRCLCPPHRVMHLYGIIPRFAPEGSQFIRKNG